MNSIWWQVAGWTMIHFLWVGSLVFLVTALVRLVLFRAAPQWRYAASLLGLAVLALSPLLIALRIASEVEPLAVVVELADQVVDDRYAAPLAASGSPAILSEVAPLAPAVIDLKYTPITVEAPSPEEPFVASPTETVVVSQIMPPPAPSTAEPTFDPQWVLQALPSYLPWLWMIGTPATLLLLATGLMGSERLRRRAEPITDPALFETLARLTAALRLSRRVTIAVSDRVLQPVLVGIVRPLVLLPSVALTSWSPAEIEMALLHELAHVRRWDNLVNLLQRLVESLLFFHPAVWITSRWVRADREHCCDAVVVAHCGNRHAYANLLVSVAKQSMNRRLPSPAMAMTSHPLAKRVRRILQLEDDPMLVSKRTLLSVAVLLAALTAGAVWSSTLAEETKPSEAKPVSRVVPDPGKEKLTTESTEKKGEPEASAPGVGEGTTESTESTEDSAKELVVVTDFNDTETTKTYSYDESTPFDKIKQVIEKFEKAGHKVELTKSGKQLQIVVTRGTNTEDAEIAPAGDKWPIVFEAGMNPMTMQSLAAELTRRGKKCTINRGGQSIEVVYEGLTVSGTKAAIYPDRIVASDGKDTVELPVTPRDALGANNLPFLSLEDQRIADLAYGMLGVEVAAIDAEELAAVKEKGFAGGVRIESVGSAMNANPLERGPRRPSSDWSAGDILVGLHVWPTADFDQLGEVLRRGDLNQFVPLKFFVLRREMATTGSSKGGFAETVPSDKWTLHTGRIAFDSNKWNNEQIRLKHALPLPRQSDSVKAEPAEASAEDASRTASPFSADHKVETQREKAREQDAQIERKHRAAEIEQQKNESPQLLYDGRTFDDWRTEWKTELKTENRTEAIKALRAFGRAGYGKEATEAILEVAEEYPMTSIGHEGSPQETLQTAIVYSFVDINDSSPIPSEVAIPIILDWYDNEDNRVRLTKWVLSMTSSNDTQLLSRIASLADDPEWALDVLSHLLRSDPDLNQEITQRVLRQCLRSDQVSIVVSAAAQLRRAQAVVADNVYRQEFAVRALPAEVALLLFHHDLQVRQSARWALKYASTKQLQNLPEVLMAIAEHPDKSATFGGVTLVEESDNPEVLKSRKLDALRALAAIGPKAQSMSDRVVELFEGDDDDDIKALAEWTINYLHTEPRPQGGAVVAVPRELVQRIDAAMKDRRKLDSKIEWNKESSELLPLDGPSDLGGGGMF